MVTVISMSLQALSLCDPVAGELGDGQRHQQQRRGEDRRDDAGGVDLQRQVRALRLHLPARGLALGILDQHPPLRALHEADDQDQARRQTTITPMISSGESEPVRPPSNIWPSALRQLGDDARHDDQRDAVADAAAGDLLAEPHQEHRAADQRDDGGDAEHDARVDAPPSRPSMRPSPRARWR